MAQHELGRDAVARSFSLFEGAPRLFSLLQPAAHPDHLEESYYPVDAHYAAFLLQITIQEGGGANIPILVSSGASIYRRHVRERGSDYGDPRMDEEEFFNILLHPLDSCSKHAHAVPPSHSQERKRRRGVSSTNNDGQNKEIK